MKHVTAVIEQDADSGQAVSLFQGLMEARTTLAVRCEDTSWSR